MSNAKQRRIDCGVLRPGVEYEFDKLLISREISRGAVTRMLVERAEKGGWELDRLRLGADGIRRVQLRRRIIRQRIAYLIFIEALFVSILGILLGTALGYYLAGWMFKVATQMDFIRITIYFSWSGFMAGVGIVCGVVLLVSLLTLHYIKKINIADVIRERSS